jgi:hypothetical protein
VVHAIAVAEDRVEEQRSLIVLDGPEVAMNNPDNTPGMAGRTVEPYERLTPHYSWRGIVSRQQIYVGPEPATVEAVYRPRPAGGRWTQTTTFALPVAAAFTALRVIATLPLGILRRCRYPDCQAVFLANRRQRYCELHQDEARRLRYRRASATYYRKKHRAARRRTRRPVVAGHRWRRRRHLFRGGSAVKVLSVVDSWSGRQVFNTVIWPLGLMAFRRPPPGRAGRSARDNAHRTRSNVGGVGCDRHG